MLLRSAKNTMHNPIETPSERAKRIGCYCSLWDKDPDFYVKEQVPEGYCGHCERCNKPGHTRHYPGAVPYTGSWCDTCYASIRKISIIKTSLFLLLVLALIVTFIFYF